MHPDLEISDLRGIFNRVEAGDILSPELPLVRLVNTHVFFVVVNPHWGIFFY